MGKLRLGRLAGRKALTSRFHTRSRLEQKEEQRLQIVVPRNSGAGKESRTPDLNLGKVALYQLSYSRNVGQIIRNNFAELNRV